LNYQIGKSASLMWQFVRTSFLAIAAAVAVASGCGDGRPARVPVSGQVLIDGEPLQFGSVRFVPAGGRASYGELDKDGRFKLTCYGENDGVVLGKHRVEVAAGEPIGSTKMKWHAPKKYANFASSPLEQEINAANDSVVIKLSWDGGKPFVEIVDAAGGDRPRFAQPPEK
jgi:hypothetical protein